MSFISNLFRCKSCRRTEESNNQEEVTATRLTQSDENIETNQADIMPQLSKPAHSLFHSDAHNTVTECIKSNAEMKFFENIVCDLIKEQNIQNISNIEIKLIIKSLFYIGQENVEKLKERLKIIPPGPVFFTWVAHNGNLFFDGKNNRKGYDYISKLKEETTFLSECDIPTFLVYSSNNMDDEEKKRLIDIGKNNKNIVFINLEIDLKDIYKTHAIHHLENNELLDALRLFVIEEYRQIIDICKAKSRIEGKDKLAQNFDIIGYSSISYSDFDNEFINKPRHILSVDGYCGVGFFEPEEVTVYTRLGDKAKLFREKFEYMFNCNLTKKEKHELSIEYMDYIINEKSEVFDEVLLEYRGYWYTKLNKKYAYWQCDNGYFRVSCAGIKDFVKQMDLKSATFFYNDFKDERSALSGIQQTTEIIIGRDRSWILDLELWSNLVYD